MKRGVALQFSYCHKINHRIIVASFVEKGVSEKIEYSLNKIEDKSSKFVLGLINIEKNNLEENELRQEIGIHLEISSNLEIAIKKGLKIAQNIGHLLL